MTCVLAAHDSRSDCPVVFGARLATLFGLPLVAASAYRPESRFVTSRLEPDTVTERRRGEAVDALAEVRGIVGPDIDVTLREISASSPSDGLVELADEVGALLVVVGEDLQGHTARDVVRQANRPVVVAPRDPRRTPEHIGTIGVGYDGSPAGRHALLIAARVAMASGAGLRLVAVDEGRLIRGRAHRDRLANALEEASDEWRDRLAVQTRLVRGMAGITLRAELADVELVVCGTHARGPAAGALLGSVSRVLIDDPAAPVIVVGHSSLDRSRKLWPVDSEQHLQTP